MPRFLLLAALSLSLSSVLGFSPLASTSSLALRSPNAALAMRSSRALSLGPKMMAEEGENKPIFEDDVDAGAPAKQANRGGISDSMRAKLMKESQAMGGDPDAPAINFAVVIGGVIATLLVFGSLIGAL